MAETTCGKCMYFDLSYDEFPCDVCLNKMKDVEDALPANWPPKDEDIPENEKSCSNCRFYDISTSRYPCKRCIEEPSYEKFWEPEEEKSVDFANSALKAVSSWMSLSYPPRYGKTQAASVIVKNIGFDPIKPTPKPFWIVCANAGTLEAHVRHDSEKSAVDEAHRLAIKTGKTFQVFKSVAVVTGKTTASQENYA